MKNIEKFQTTTVALSHWKLEPPETRPPFDEWLQANAEPRTRRGKMLWRVRELLAALDYRYAPQALCHDTRLALAHQLKEEERNPTRRYEVYTSPDAANKAFYEACRMFPQCAGCRYARPGAVRDDWNCQLRWLYDEATDDDYGKEADR